MKLSFIKHFVCGHSSVKDDNTPFHGNPRKTSRPRTSKETERSSTTIQATEKDKEENYNLVFAEGVFNANYPQYHSPLLDEFRAHDYTRIGDLVYLDYTGASLYPEGLVRQANEILLSEVLGNPHSSNPASRSASDYAASARKAVLKFFDADPEIYSVVWTANATGAAKIVGESYPWAVDSVLLLPSDTHNSLNGLRRFAETNGSTVQYYDLHNYNSQTVLSTSVPSGLFCLTGQSNVSGLQGDLTSIRDAAAQGYNTLLDAAALAPTTPISLSGGVLNNNVDAMIISLYKIIGYPTGLGALIVKNQFLQLLEKPWFCGGTVDVVQVPGHKYTLEDGVSRFEDGTSNFLSFNVIPQGLSLISGLIPSAKPRILSLTHWTIRSLRDIKHPRTNNPLVYIRSPPSDISYDTLSKHYGGTIALEVVDADGAFINCEAIEYVAGQAHICVRAGCVCNPGGTSDLTLGAEIMRSIKSGDTKEDLEDRFGVRSRGIVRVSFGIASNFTDAWRFVEFMRSLTLPMRLFELQSEWKAKQESL